MSSFVMKWKKNPKNKKGCELCIAFYLVFLKTKKKGEEEGVWIVHYNLFLLLSLLQRGNENFLLVQASSKLFICSLLSQQEKKQNKKVKIYLQFVFHILLQAINELPFRSSRMVHMQAMGKITQYEIWFLSNLVKFQVWQLIHTFCRNLMLCLGLWLVFEWNTIFWLHIKLNLWKY